MVLLLPYIYSHNFSIFVLTELHERFIFAGGVDHFGVHTRVIDHFLFFITVLSYHYNNILQYITCIEQPAPARIPTQ